MDARILLQQSTNGIGGSPLVIVLALLGLFVTVALSLVVAYLVVRGYRRNRNRARLFLAAGLILLTTGPILIQLVLTNFMAVPAVVRSAAANASKLLGLGAMLYAIYGVSNPRTNTKTGDAGGSRVRR
ncbi:hypothetical protein ACFFQF_01155 [Haladaptatus pallidirubidus]|uniref:Uncharacterized protein n=1 Tax=Haladaptatus pallidirubidus TaxID=1008152 RepID=A0AAV3UCU6_9EURY|nr:hypothetical protein [Haladaptatus pallidirubidus]